MWAYRRPGALEGRCLQRPRSRKRLPSKDFHADDAQMKILAKLRDLGCQQYTGNMKVVGVDPFSIVGQWQ